MSGIIDNFVLYPEFDLSSLRVAGWVTALISRSNSGDLFQMKGIAHSRILSICSLGGRRVTVSGRMNTKTREEGTPLSWSSTLGGFHHVMNALMALLIGLKYATGMENLITLLVVALVFYFGLMSFAKIFHADHDHRDFGAFINKISILFGIFALIIELLIIVLAYGSVPLFLWSICMVSLAVAVLVLLRLASVELREKLILITGHLMQYWTTFYDSSAVASQEMINLDHEAQDQNQIKELPAV